MKEFLILINEANFSVIVFLVGSLMFLFAAIKFSSNVVTINIPLVMRFVLGGIGLFFMVLGFVSGIVSPNADDTVVPEIADVPEISPDEEVAVIPDEPSVESPISKHSSDIVARGIISIGVHNVGTYPIAYPEGETYTGFEAELAIEIVKRLFGDQNQVAINWVPLTTSERFDALENGSIDFLIRNITHTVLREEDMSFSQNYFLDGVRLLVRKSDDYESITDLAGKTIVAPGEIFASVTRAAASAAGVEVNVIVDENPKTVFLEGRADAVATYWVSHGYFVDDYSSYRAIGELINQEPFGIVFSKSDVDFRDEVDRVLLEIIEDGTWQTLYDNWFPEPPPWTIDEMQIAPPPIDILRD